MCECGCVSNNEYYKFPGPGKSFYILSLVKHCVNCSGPSAIGIDHIKPENEFYYNWYKNKDNYHGDLKFEKCSDGYSISTIITGMLKSEFVDSIKEHLIGLDSKDFSENRKIDEFGAEAIVEEMYEDAQIQPSILL